MSHETFFDANKNELSPQPTMELWPDMTPFTAGQSLPQSLNQDDNTTTAPPDELWPLNLHDFAEMACERAMSSQLVEDENEDLDDDLDDDDDDELDLDFDDDDDDELDDDDDED
ncbi:hypothetical protein JYU10_00715 [bacterium AH-315-J04]|nr:hypothetical protein [bacterium AH-315-J04]